MTIALCVKENDYEGAFKYIKEAMDKGHWVNPDILIEVSKKLNVIFPVDYSAFSYNYTMNQVLDYDPYVAMDHIIDRHIDFHNSDFNPDVDVYKLFNSIKEQIANTPRNKKIGFNDIYIIPVPNVGANGENYLKVVTLPNTDDIVTMYPTFKKYNIDLDNNTLEELEDEVIQRVLVP